LLLSGGGDKRVMMWNTERGVMWDGERDLCVLELKEHTGLVNSVRFSPDGKNFVSASKDKTARVYDVTTGRCVLKLEDHARGVTCADFSPDSKFIATTCIDKVVRVWDVRQPDPVKSVALFSKK
jgi:WD40 repeat protein